VLLPDGDDPDSFSKKMGSTDFKKYLKDHTKDFISFKIDLLAAESNHDPIKKAEAIREIVTSISLIPDPIKRSVYIQETGQLLKIQETVLLTELNKILIGERQKDQQEKTRNNNKAPVADILPDVATGSKLDTSGMVQVQERETIRLLLNYAENAYDDKRLIDFMMAELEDVEFVNPVYKEIYLVFREGAERGEVRDPLYFMEHGSTTARNMVAELTTSRYETSKSWGEEFHIYFPHEREILQDVAYTNVLRLKFRMIQKLMEENLQQMKVATTEEDLEKYFTIHEQLKGAEKELAVMLGIVVAK
jgi:DNA primase